MRPSRRLLRSLLRMRRVSGGLMLLPDSAGTSKHPHILIGCGKNGTIFVVDRDNMGQFNSSNDSQIIGEVTNVISNYCYSSPAYWQGNVYIGGTSQSLEKLSFANGQLSTSAVSNSSDVFEFPGTSPVVSASGSSQGIVWAIENAGTSGPDDTGTTAVLHAYDATNLAVELYSSNQVASDAAGAPVKFTIPVVANGKVYVGTQSAVAVYGLRVTTPTVNSVSPNNGPATGGTAVTIAGANYAVGATVTIGGTAATNVVVVNSTTITATTPAHAAGAATVTVTVNSQSGSQTNGFTYITTPTVSSVSPNSGSTAGGTAVTITGTNFAAGATVTIGGAAATIVVALAPSPPLNGQQSPVISRLEPMERPLLRAGRTEAGHEDLGEEDRARVRVIGGSRGGGCLVHQQGRAAGRSEGHDAHSERRPTSRP